MKPSCVRWVKVGPTQHRIGQYTIRSYQSLKMIVFALRAFCFELSIASSTLNLLYSPQALQNWSQSCRGSPVSCYVPDCRSKRANLARLRPNLTFFNDQQQQQKLPPALLASFLSLSYTRLWICKVRTKGNNYL